MSKTLKAIAMFLVITAIIFAAGCIDKQTIKTNSSQNNITPATEATPTPTPSDPQLVISPDNKFSSVTLDDSPVKINDKVTMKSILGDAYNISLNAYPDDENNISVKVDEIEGGPFLSDKIVKDDKQYVNMSIELAPQCSPGNYTILLKANYHDITNQEYSTSGSIIVNVNHKSTTDKLEEIIEGIKK